MGMKKARAEPEEWLTEADRLEADSWPVGATRFWFLLEEAQLRDLANGILPPEVPGMAIRCLTPIRNEEKVNDENELARTGKNG